MRGRFAAGFHRMAWRNGLSHTGYAYAGPMFGTVRSFRQHPALCRYNVRILFRSL